MTLFAAWLLLVAQLANLPASAQTSDTIPRELMEILLGPPGVPRESFDLRIGAPPSGFPADLLPEGAVIGASAIFPLSTTVVGTLDAPVATARPAYEARLAAAGWISPMPQSRGFTSSLGTDMISLCRANDFATAMLSSRKQGGSYVKVTLRTDVRQACAARPNPFFTDIDIPVLRHPAGTKAYGGGGGGSADTFESRASIDSPLEAGDLLAHYSAQMLSAGWTLAGQAGSPDVATVARFSSTTVRKEPITALLTITQLEQSGRRFELSLRIFRHSR
jgi:hypothetical protein